MEAEATILPFCQRHYRLAVKNHQLDGLPCHIPATELAGLTRASQIVERIEAESRDILEQARKDGERIREQVRAEVTREVWTQADGLLRTLKATNDWRRETVAQFAAEVAAAAVKEMLGKAPPPARMKRVIQQLLDQADREPEATLVVHPDDREAVPENINDTGWQVEARAGMEPGHCRLETPHGDYQASFDGLLQVFLDRIRQSAMTTGSQSGAATGTGSREQTPTDTGPQ